MHAFTEHSDRTRGDGIPGLLAGALFEPLGRSKKEDDGSTFCVLFDANGTSDCDHNQGVDIEDAVSSSTCRELLVK